MEEESDERIVFRSRDDFNLLWTDLRLAKNFCEAQLNGESREREFETALKASLDHFQDVARSNSQSGVSGRSGLILTAPFAYTVSPAVAGIRKAVLEMFVKAYENAIGAWNDFPEKRYADAFKKLAESDRLLKDIVDSYGVAD